MPWFSRSKASPADPFAGSDPLARFLALEIRRRNGAGVEFDEKAIGRIEDAAARARGAIEAGSAQAQVLLPFLLTTASGPVHFDATISRLDLERIDQAGPG